MLTSNEVRERFLQFFQKRGHAVIPSASLVPENDPSVLFNTAGMQPLAPYLLGQRHLSGQRLVDIQKCVRTVDIDEIGDNTHATFFEMMGNWSLGDYWKKDAIEWSYEFLTSTTEGLGLNPEHLFVTCFEGDDNAPRDTESAEIWREIFNKNNIKGERIYFRPANKNWWSAGDNGPCGPDTEMFYDLTGDLTKGMNLEEYLKADDEQRVVEIWNDVFMEYLAKDGRVVEKLKTKNIDTGSGFERVLAVVQGKTNIFDTDLFLEAITYIRDNSVVGNIKSERIVADHIRTATFMICDGVTPSNTDRGYILRRLLRRAIRHADILGLKDHPEIGASRLVSLSHIFVTKYKDVYPEIIIKSKIIDAEIEEEDRKFKKTLSEGLRQLEKFTNKALVINGKDAFVLFSTYGFPLEVILEICKEKGVSVDAEGFNLEMKKHQDLSRSGAEQRFKGGMGDTSSESIKYHTTTHLLHQALRDVLGDSVIQKGSNITAERLRFDFTHDTKMTDEEKKKVEDVVNHKIKENLTVNKVIMNKEEAEKTDATHLFGEKYGDEVSIYYIGDSLENAYSKEFCGGPHVENTGVLGHFKIVKEEAISAGVRRIKAILE
ncbi:MAG TPA: alanine--tRNA ligase [Candidatus Paceibacterota bacterium]